MASIFLSKLWNARAVRNACAKTNFIKLDNSRNVTGICTIGQMALSVVMLSSPPPSKGPQLTPEMTATIILLPTLFIGTVQLFARLCFKQSTQFIVC